LDVRSTPAKRSTANMISFGMGALLFLAFSVALFLDGHTGVAIVLFLLTLGGIYVAFRGSFEADCPACGQSVDELAEGDAKRCPNCFAYSVLLKGRFCQLAPTETKYGPFIIPLPPSIKFPGICCGCGGRMTRTIRVHQTVNLSTAAVPIMGQSKAYDLSLPACDKENPVVVLRAEATKNAIGLRRIGIFGPKSTLMNPGLFASMEVPSHRFYCGFIEMNGMGVARR
jgi:DNA-directed RNA polymerase subunit RPC12/RpoP